MGFFGFKHNEPLPNMGGNLKQVGKEEVGREKAPDGRDWTDAERDEYYNNLHTGNWAQWSKETLKLMYEKHKIDEKRGLTTELREALFSYYRSGMTAEHCANIIPPDGGEKFICGT